LINIDDVAYIRFASVYRQFTGIHDFVEEVRPILDRNRLFIGEQDDSYGF
jgi:transcriptional regulator NrdR family protein